MVFTELLDEEENAGKKPDAEKVKKTKAEPKTEPEDKNTNETEIPMSLNISLPKDEPVASLTPRISVIGVGGAGGNAINNMISSALKGARFLVANTDAQSLSLSLSDCRIQLGLKTTQGLGSGMKPEVGKAAAEEAIDKITDEIKNSNMLFITAGMGGGTGTGAAPVIAKAAQELGILTVGVVTKPFNFEGKRRMELAERGIEELSKYVDTLIVIPNQNLFRLATEKTSFADAFKMADDVLHSGVRNITDLIMVPGLINLDFADVRTVIAEMGRAMMGSSEATGENRAIEAAEQAITNQLLDDNSMKGAKGVLINITGGDDLTLLEVDAAAERIRSEVDPEANIIVGACLDSSLEGKMRVSVVATGISGNRSGVNRDAYTPAENRREMPAPIIEKIAIPTLENIEEPKEEVIEEEQEESSVISSMPPADKFFSQIVSPVIKDIDIPEPELPNEPIMTQEIAPETEEIKEQASFFIPQEPVLTIYEDGLAPEDTVEIEPEAPKYQEEIKPKASLLEKVASLSLGRHARPEISPLSDATAQTTEKEKSYSEDDLEIPSFLRRHSS